MKAVLYSAPREFAVGDVNAVEPGPRDVRIRVHQTGLCGTDKHIHEGDFTAEFPLVPGHEIVGTVESIGAEVTSVQHRAVGHGQPQHELRPLRPVPARAASCCAATSPASAPTATAASPS